MHLGRFRALALPALLGMLTSSIAACGQDAQAGMPEEPAPGEDEDTSSDERDATAHDDTTDPRVHELDGSQRDAAGDMAAEDAGSDPGADAGSTGPAACEVTGSYALCTSRSVVTIGAASDKRPVYWAKPTKAAPKSGYPAVILYQGSYFGPDTTWDVKVDKGMAFGGYHQVRLVAELLERGYVVIQPEAQGGTFWSTNISTDFATSSDGVFIPVLLSAMENGSFGPLDSSRLYATGISSGGYMTSRMAVSFAGRFRALAIQSGSYANCGGPLCNVPAKLPADHPPTLFLHGGADAIVPIGTAKDYYGKLQNQGIEAKFIEEPAAGHEWLAVAPEDIATWFQVH